MGDRPWTRRQVPVRSLPSRMKGEWFDLSALKTPSVVVFTASDPARWAPLDGRRHRAILASRATVPLVVAAAEEVRTVLSPL